MAIDTREKRQAMFSFCNTTVAPTPTPNATPDDEWRVEMLWLYPGIIPDAPGGGGALTNFFTMAPLHPLKGQLG